MFANVIVMSEEDFKEWNSKDPDADLPPVAMGEKMYQKQACASCHSLDGSKIIGPTFKGLFGRQETLADGSTVDVDENYIRTSMMDPQAQVVQGYTPVMPPYKGTLTEAQITGIIEYIKTLK